MESLKIMSNISLKIQHGNQSLILVHTFSSNFEFEDQIKFVNSNVNSNNLFKEPYQELWKKVLGTIFYLLQTVMGLIPFTLAIFEREGYGGHFRTVLNQLTSLKYMIVSNFQILNWHRLYLLLTIRLLPGFKQGGSKFVF